MARRAADVDPTHDGLAAQVDDDHLAGGRVGHVRELLTRVHGDVARVLEAAQHLVDAPVAAVDDADDALRGVRHDRVGPADALHRPRRLAGRRSVAGRAPVAPSTTTMCEARSAVTSTEPVPRRRAGGQLRQDERRRGRRQQELASLHASDYAGRSGRRSAVGHHVVVADADDRAEPVAPGEASGPVGSAGMSGSSIAGPTAALWVTDFLNAAYYARDPAERSLADLRLARSILATSCTAPAPLSPRDLIGFHRSFGGHRFRSDGSSARGRLSGDELLAGAVRLHGDWFADAAQDPARRGWGVVFEDAAALAAFEPERRLESGALGALSPPAAPAEQQHWRTYRPVPVRSATATAAALHEPRRWTDYGSAIGQFTAVRRGGLLGQTFEIEIVVPVSPLAPARCRVRT